MAKNTQHPKVSKEFKNILPSLSDIEFKSLEQDVLKRGILQPVFVWNGICIDGMHRLKIAKTHKLKYQIKELRFDNKQEAKVWVFEHQVGRRNQSPFSKINAGLKFEDYYKTKAKENQRKSPGRGKKGIPTVGKSIDTTRIIAKKIGVAHSYISDVKFILKNGTKTLIQECHNGEVSIRKAYFRCHEKKKSQAKRKTAGKEGYFKNPKAGEYINQIINGDCLKVMPKMIKDGLEGKITNIICSPPYNAGKDYGKNHDDNLPYHKYLKWLGKVIQLSAKLLRKGGRLIWVVSDVGNRQDKDGDGDSYCHTTYPDLINLVRELDCGLKFRDCIIWAKGNRGSMGTAYGSYRSASSPILRSNHEHIVIWSKEQWDLPDILGSKPDISKEEFLNWTFSVWTINPITDKKAKHPYVYPPQLVERLIKLYSYPGDIVLDNFNGSGITTSVASALGREWIGIEQNAGYCKYAKGRLSKNLK